MVLICKMCSKISVKWYSPPQFRLTRFLARGTTQFENVLILHKISPCSFPKFCKKRSLARVCVNFGKMSQKTHKKLRKGGSHEFAIRTLSQNGFLNTLALPIHHFVNKQLIILT